jgi:hypothetical protein
MSQIKVDTITNTEDNGPVYFPKGMLGDASHLIYPPQVLSFDPTPLSTGISTASEQNITVTFNQGIVFSGVGTISLRQGSATGTELESYTCGVSTRATIAGESLVVKPSVQLGINTSIYLVLPSTGIANTSGGNYAGSSSYFFQTLTPGQNFSATGGTHEFVRADFASPTGYYKYHIFTSSGPFVTSGPSVDADDFKALIIGGGGAGGDMYLQPSSQIRYGGGGGGAGGRIYQTGPEMSLISGTYTVTIGAGGIGTSGNNTTIASPTATIITAYGGGFGGQAEFGPGAAGSGLDGGSGGGGGGVSTPFNPGNSTNGTGISGQGNNGGSLPGENQMTNPNNTVRGSVGAGGGGAGGTGGNGVTTRSSPAPNTSAIYRGPGSAGPGGPGLASPEFSSPILAPLVPTIPADSFSKIGSSGLYAGGGGGAGIHAPQYGYPSPNYPGGVISRGTGGPGGGGNGIFYPSPSTSTDNSETGFTNTGGGGGGGGSPSSSQPAPSPGANYGGNPAAGGSGVFMVRYATPAP